MATALVMLAAVVLYVPERPTQEEMTASGVPRSAGDVSQGTLVARSFDQNVRDNWVTRRVRRGWEWKVQLVRSWFGGFTSGGMTAQAQTKSKAPAVFHFPLTKGTYWVYEGEVDWAPEPTKADAKATEKIQWTMKVLDVKHYGGATIALIEGHPSDLIWYEPGRKPGRHTLLRTSDGRYILDPDFEDVDDKHMTAQILDASPDDAFFKEGVNSHACISKQDGERDDAMYCWFLESMKRGPVPLRNIDAESDLYKVGYRAVGSHELLTLASGFGIVSYDFGHHGSVSNVRLSLVEFHPGPVTIP